MDNLDVSIIISFYNDFKNLLLVLAGLERQTFKKFEIIIADDGSNQDTIDKINLLLNTSPLPMQHVWHEDKGWRKNEILNKAILASRTGYLIFIDGDCIPHSHFIEEHLKNKQKQAVLAGRRVNLSFEVSKLLSPSKVKNGLLEKRYFLLSWYYKLFLGKGSHIENGFYLNNRFILNHLNKKTRGILGSNFSIHKEDLMAVNGFDERYRLPAVGEDSDLEVRLGFNGVKIKTLKHRAIQYHLFHEKLERNTVNLEIFEKTKRNKIAYTPFGINKPE